MGRHYSVDLYFPYENIAGAFEAVYQVADNSGFHHITEIALMDGTTIGTLFQLETYRNWYQTNRLFPGDELHTILSINFPVDEAVQGYIIDGLSHPQRPFEKS